tara:strand:+ start:2037 stop:2840 length:804 start_codon:yes stop_codon:yes gene_type:complete
MTDAVQGIDDEEDEDDEDGLGVAVGEGVIDTARRGQDDIDAVHVEGLDEVLEGDMGCEDLFVTDEGDVEEDGEESRDNSHGQLLDHVFSGVSVHIEEEGDGPVDVRQAAKLARKDSGGKEKAGDNNVVQEEAVGGCEVMNVGIGGGNIDDGLAEEGTGEGKYDLAEKDGARVKFPVHAGPREDDKDDGEQGHFRVGEVGGHHRVDKADEGEHDGAVKTLVDVDEVRPVRVRFGGHVPGRKPAGYIPGRGDICKASKYNVYKSVVLVG